MLHFFYSVSTLSLMLYVGIWLCICAVIVSVIKFQSFITADCRNDYRSLVAVNQPFHGGAERRQTQPWWLRQGWPAGGLIKLSGMGGWHSGGLCRFAQDTGVSLSKHWSPWEESASYPQKHMLPTVLPPENSHSFLLCFHICPVLVLCVVIM